MIVLQQKFQEFFLLRNIQLTEGNSFPGIFMTLNCVQIQLEIIFWLPFNWMIIVLVHITSEKFYTRSYMYMFIKSRSSE